MLELKVIEVAVKSSLMQDFVWPFLASVAAVFVSLWGSYLLYRYFQSRQAQKEQKRSEDEAKAAHRRAWASIIFEVSENRTRLKWLIDNTLTPQLQMLKQSRLAVRQLSLHRLRTSAIDISFADGTIRYLGDLSFQVRLKNEREQCVDLNLSLEHADSLFTSVQSFDNRIAIMTDLYDQLLDTATKGRISLEKLFDELNSDDLRPTGQGCLDLDEIERLTIEKAKALEDQAKSQT